MLVLALSLLVFVTFVQKIYVSHVSVCYICSKNICFTFNVLLRDLWNTTDQWQDHLSNYPERENTRSWTKKQKCKQISCQERPTNKKGKKRKKRRGKLLRKGLKLKWHQLSEELTNVNANNVCSVWPWVDVTIKTWTRMVPRCIHTLLRTVSIVYLTFIDIMTC